MSASGTRCAASSFPSTSRDGRTKLLSVEHRLTFLTQQLFDGTSLGRLREVPEPDEFNPPLADGLAHPLIAQRPQLNLALRSVAGRKSRLYIAGMAGQLGHAIPDLLVQQAKEPFDPDLLKMGIATPLPVELRDMADFRVASHWHRDAPRPREHLRE